MADRSSIICPDCGAPNLVGDEECSSCLAPLVPMERQPASFLVKDTVAMLGLVQPATVPPQTTLRHVIEAMRDHPDGCVMVVLEGRLEGIFTVRDALLRVAAKNMDLDNVFVQSVMTPNPQTIHTTEPISAAVNKMAVRGMRHLPVLDESENLVGHITMTMLLRYLHSREPAEV